MGTVHSGKISHLTWTFTKKYWAVLGCTGLYWAVLGHLRYLLGNVQVKWRILPLCNGLLQLPTAPRPRVRTTRTKINFYWTSARPEL